MTITRKCLASGALVIAAAVFTASCGADGAGGSSAAVKIGVIAPLSGTQPDRGKIIQVAAQLAIDDLNADESQDGRKYEMVLLDDANITNQAVSGAQRLIQSEKVVAISGIISSSSQQAIQPLAERAQTVVMGMIATATGLTDGFRYAFRATGSNNTIGPQIVQLAKQHGITDVAVMNDDSSYAQSLTDEVLKGAKAAGVTVRTRQLYKTGSADVSAQIANIRSSGAEAVLAFPINGADIATISRTMVQNGVNVPIYSHNGVFTKEAVQLAGPYFAKLPAVYGMGSVDLARPDTKAFYERMDTAAGFEVPQNEDAGQTYDAIRLIGRALAASDGKGGADLVKALEGIDKYEGIAGAKGSYYSFNADKHTGLTGNYLVAYKFEKGAFVPVGTAAGQR